MNNNLSVIIPTLNNVNGLSYLLNYFKGKSYQKIVVDNRQESLSSIPIGGGSDTEHLVYLPQKKNLGFAGGVNKGAKDVETKWMLVLNDDIEFEEMDSRLRGNDIEKSKTIESLVKYAEENNLDAVSPILRNPNGEVENYGYRVLPIGRVELIKEIDSRLRGNNSNIDGITAACLLVKTKVFKKLGGFDESFFAYLEDVDFFLRMKKMDPRLRGDDNMGRGNDRLPFGIAYDIEVLHNHMTTSKTMGNFKARQDMVNWWRLFFKHPEKFKFNIQFLIERLRNVSGYLKASFK